MKKYRLTIIILFISILSLLEILIVYAVPSTTGCCINPGESSYVCREFIRTEGQCCPVDFDSDGNPNYDLISNPRGPRFHDEVTAQDDCIQNFFIAGQVCSQSNAEDACFRPGCCCVNGVEDTLANKKLAKCTGQGSQFFVDDAECSQCIATNCFNDDDDEDLDGDGTPDGDGCIDELDPDCIFGTPPFIETNDNTGACLPEPVICTPELTNLDVTPNVLARTFTLTWIDQCDDDSVEYVISRCEGVCSAFDIITIPPLSSLQTRTITYIDETGIDETGDSTTGDGGLLYNTDYTYEVKAFYDQHGQTPTIEGLGNLGDLECSDKTNQEFCLQPNSYLATDFRNYLTTNLPKITDPQDPDYPGGFSLGTETFLNDVKIAFGSSGDDILNSGHTCDTNHRLVEEIDCTNSEICVDSDGTVSCLEIKDCNYDVANPFGLFYNQPQCEIDNAIDPPQNYCFYDRSHTVADSCYKCDPSMSCYDYKTEEACKGDGTAGYPGDNCMVENCEWHSITNNPLSGVCVSTILSNCQWCNTPGTGGMENLVTSNVVFDRCTQEKSGALEVIPDLKCFFTAGSSKSCDDVKCTDYASDPSPEQCGSGFSLGDGNVITKGNDNCKIGVCKVLGGKCKKDADDHGGADCSDGDDNCELDYFPPTATITNFTNSRKILDDLNIDVKDKIAKQSPVHAISNYVLYFCLDGENCPSPLRHPFDFSTTASTLLVTNLRLSEDSIHNTYFFDLNDGTGGGDESRIWYYANDSNNNVGLIKEITFKAFLDRSGPRVVPSLFKINGGIIDPAGNGKYYVRTLETITVTFTEGSNAVVASSNVELIAEDETVTNPSSIIESGEEFEFIFNGLVDGEYDFDLYTANIDGIPMSSHYREQIVVDNSVPEIKEMTLGSETIVTGGIISGETIVLGQSSPTLDIEFSEEVEIQSVKVFKAHTGEEELDVTEDINTVNDEEFDAQLNALSEGPKRLEILASDFTGNALQTTTFDFVVNARPLKITLVNPTFEVSSTETFTLIIETDNKATCGYDTEIFVVNFPLITFPTDETMSSDTFGLIHTSTADPPDKVSHGDTETFHVQCKDFYNPDTIELETFEISVDTSKPKFITLFMQPNASLEASEDHPSDTEIKVKTDDETRCKYNVTKNAADFDVNALDFNNMTSFDNFALEAEDFYTEHLQEITLDDTEPGNSEIYTFYIICENKAELLSSTRPIAFEVDPDLELEIYSDTMDEFYSPPPNVELLIRTNLETICSLDEGIPWSSESTTVHILDLGTRSQGRHKFNVTCFWKSGEWISELVIFTVDTSPPDMIFVNDSSTLINETEITCIDDQLRVKWFAEDAGSGVKFYTYSIFEETGTEDIPIISGVESRKRNKWLRVRNLNLIDNLTYYFTVNATDWLSFTTDSNDPDGISDGIEVDTTFCEENNIVLTCRDRGDCGIGEACTDDSECAVGYCSSTNVCATPSCNDGIENQDETDIDCGGSCSSKCQTGKSCFANADCQTNNCKFGTCKEPDQCSNGNLDTGEAATDCGGICPTKCSEGKTCSQDNDCKQELECFGNICKMCAENDADCNGIPDFEEDDTDSDGDGCPDAWEIQYGFNSNDNSDCSDLDSDGDGLSNLEEYTYGTDPNKADTDGDKYSDKEEIDNGTDPLDPKDKPKSKLGFILLLVFLVILLIAGSYFGYVYYTTKKEEKKAPSIRTRKPMIVPGARVAAPGARRLPSQRPRQKIGLREMTKREEEKRRQRAKLFEKFGGKAEKPEKKKPSVELKKPIEEIAKVKQQVKKMPTIKHKEDTIQKLKDITKKTDHEKKSKEDVFKELKKITKRKKK